MIQSDPEDLEQTRERLRKMSDLELRKYGRAAADMASPKKNYGKPNPAFQIQLDEARAEWRRRHATLVTEDSALSFVMQRAPMSITLQARAILAASTQ
jgi:hypothetical protein